MNVLFQYFRRGLFLALVGYSCAVAAQVSTGTIEGNVTDSTGAATPHATVMVTDTQTGIVTKTTTSATGFYSAPSL